MRTYGAGGTVTENEGKWRSPKEWYEEEYAPKSQWDHAYRKGGTDAIATLLLASSFLIRYSTLDRWAMPTLRDVLLSIPLMLIGAGILLYRRSPDYKRKEAKKWGWHDRGFKELPSADGIRHQATCRCGWEGPIRESKDEAMLDQVDHRLAEERTRRGEAAEGERP